MITRGEFLKSVGLAAAARLLPAGNAPRRLLLQYDEPDIVMVSFTHRLIEKLRAGAALTWEDRETIAESLDSHLTCWDVAPRASELHGPERRRFLRQASLEQLKHMNSYRAACEVGNRERMAFHDGASCGLSYAQKLLSSGGDSIHLGREWYRKY